MHNELMIPQPGSPVTAEGLAHLEHAIAEAIPAIEDLPRLEELRSGSCALEAYLRGKELSAPALGMQRRIEARIGQLLGEETPGRRSDIQPCPHDGKVERHDRNQFRRLACGIGVLTDEDWRQSRRSLLTYLNERYPLPRRQPEVIVTKNGAIKKCRPARITEISNLAHSGHTAAQIAIKLGVTSQQIKNIAKAEEIRLSKADSRVKQPDPVKILDRSLADIALSVEQLSILKKMKFPQLEEGQLNEWIQMIKLSIKGLRSLQSLMGKYHARPE